MARDMWAGRGGTELRLLRYPSLPVSNNKRAFSTARRRSFRGWRSIALRTAAAGWH